MSTKEELQDTYRAQFKLFGGYGIPAQAYESPFNNLGLADYPSVDSPSNKSDFGEFNGKLLGSVEFDPEARELNIFTKTEKD
nr:hypothetical protein [uncultured Carboxylicivirga sp.]